MKTIDDFLSVINKHNGLARPALYQLIIGGISSKTSDREIDNGETFTILCDKCTIPGRTINTTDAIYQNNTIKIPTGHSVENVDISFILTGDYLPRKVLENWANSIVNREENRIAFKENYAKGVMINQFDSNSQLVYSVVLTNAYPVSVGAIDLSSGGDEILRITASLSYDDYEVVPVKNGKVEA